MLEISIILVEEYDLNTSLSFQLICLSPQLPNHYFFFVERYVDNKPEGKTNSTIAPKGQHQLCNIAADTEIKPHRQAPMKYQHTYDT